MDQLYAHVGRGIRRRRRELGFSQEELADKTPLSRASIANIEAGRQQIYLHHFLKITSALRLRFADLLPSGPATQASELDSLDDEARAFVTAGLKVKS